MDAIKMAHTIMGFYEEVDDLTEKQGERALLKAQVYAAIAQAEQLKRIAVSLEAIGHALERYVGPAPLPEAERDEYIRNSYPGESIPEYQKRIYGSPTEPSPLDNF